MWASESRTSLVFGGWVGFISITIAVFLVGFGGWLAAWGGLIGWNTNYNLYLFQLFDVTPPNATEVEAYDYAYANNPDNIDPNYLASALVHNWVGVIALILAIVMDEGAVDSLQTGICCSISGGSRVQGLV